MSGSPAVSPAGRLGWSPFVLLTLTDAVAMATLARCFTGPGELVVVVSACVVGHLLAGGGRRLAPHLASGGAGASPTERWRPSRTALTWAAWVLAIVIGLLMPLAIVDGYTFTWGVPLAHTWTVVHHQLGSAWTIFSHKVAPVAEAPGLVLAAGWAGALVALASETLYADRGLPAILSLVPAFDVIVFTGTLGTATGRAIELVVLAGLALGFLTEAQHERQASRVVLMARVEGSGRSGAKGQVSRLTGRRALPAVSVVAALAAGIIGPVLPGATSAPLVAWHGAAGGRGGEGGSFGSPGGGRPTNGNTTTVSDLVQVAEQEIDNTTSVLFTVHSRQRVRETLMTLNHFNGNAWSRGSGSSAPVPLARFPGDVSSIETRPPKPVTQSSGFTTIEQAIQIGTLGGSWLPAPGVPEAVNGDGPVTRLGADGPVLATSSLRAGLTYAVKSSVPPTNSSVVSSLGEFLQSNPPAQDLELPKPIPPSLVSLAHSLAGGAVTPYQTALRLQDYFLSGRFRYELPQVTPSGAIADASQSYVALESFLFHHKVGYCQQFATSFAVLARILGLPTRIAVGFLPGAQIGSDEYSVTGADVHAWPEVDLGAAGWVTFEPTPGVASASGPGSITGGTVPPVSPGGSTGHGSPVHNFRQITGGGQTTPVAARARAGHGPANRRPGGSSGVGDVLLALVALACAWLLTVPTWRAVRRRRERLDLARSTAAAWRAALAMLAAGGTHRRRAETHREFADRVRFLGLLNDQASEALSSLAKRMDRFVYAPAAPTADDARSAWAESKVVCRSARRRVPRWQRLSLLVDPRDLLGSAA